MGGLLYTNLNLPIGKGKYPCDDNEMRCVLMRVKKEKRQMTNYNRLLLLMSILFHLTVRINNRIPQQCTQVSFSFSIPYVH